jgi:multicomponent Na+:H+ antiporter subunit C
MSFTLSNISLAIGILLILAGIWAALTQKNIIKIIIGFSLFDTGIHIVMVALGYIRNHTAPIIDSEALATNTADKIVDPVPQALVLTAIVIGLGVTALMLVYALKMFKEKKSLDINSFKDLKW